MGAHCDFSRYDEQINIIIMNSFTYHESILHKVEFHTYNYFNIIKFCMERETTPSARINSHESHSSFKNAHMHIYNISSPLIERLR